MDKNENGFRLQIRTVDKLGQQPPSHLLEDREGFLNVARICNLQTPKKIKK